MDEFLYRYINFETLVGMIQEKALTFVLPELWEDPYEGKPLLDFLIEKKNTYERIILTLIYQKTFGQCWTTLSESDAMWRIYSYNNRAVRIKVSKDKISKLKNIDIVPVTYSDEPFEASGDNKQTFIKLLSYKRLAFEHEKEVRLIHHYKFLSDDDLEKHIKAFMVISEHEQMVDLIENLFPGLEMEEQVRRICEMTNYGKYKQTVHKISFDHIADFIDGVMVHPQASDWYVDVVGEYCKINSIPFEGKSSLYSI